MTKDNFKSKIIKILNFLWKGFQDSMNHQVKKREVFYFSGYDPRGARYYHNLYKKESQLQNRINDMDVQTGSRFRSSEKIQSWEIKSKTTITNYNYLVWDDIVRKAWIKDIFSLYIHLFYYCKYYIFTGATYKTIKTSPRQIYILLYPVIYILFSLILVLFVWYYAGFSMNAIMPFYISYVLAIVPAYFLMKLLMKFAEKISIFWLLSDYVFFAKYIFGKNIELNERIEIFTKNILNKLIESNPNKVDEILFVTHSVGAVLLIPVLEKILTNSNLDENKIKKISILTLGEFIPLVLFLDKATVFREQMKTIANNENIFWLDYTSVADGISFSLDYFKSISLNVKFKQVFKSPRFHLLYEDKKYNEMKKNQFFFHFLYFMSTDKKGSYDFFRMTAGPNRLCSEDVK